MSEEYLDVLDGTGKKTGIKKLRREVHRDGDWHRVFHCLFIFTRGREQYCVLQLRSAHTEVAPGKIEITVTGHYSSGEGLEEVMREIEEEIGIKAASSDLIPVGMRVNVYEFQKGIINHEFQDVFFMKNARPLESYRLHPREVEGIMEARLDDIIRVFTEDGYSFKARGYRLTGEVEKAYEFTIRKDDFFPCVDNYFYRVAVLARRALNGERDLVI